MRKSRLIIILNDNRHLSDRLHHERPFSVRQLRARTTALQWSIGIAHAVRGTVARTRETTRPRQARPPRMQKPRRTRLSHRSGVGGRAGSASQCRADHRDCKHHEENDQAELGVFRHRHAPSRTPKTCGTGRGYETPGTGPAAVIAITPPELRNARIRAFPDDSSESCPPAIWPAVRAAGQPCGRESSQVPVPARPRRVCGRGDRPAESAESAGWPHSGQI